MKWAAASFILHAYRERSMKYAETGKGAGRFPQPVIRLSMNQDIRIPNCSPKDRKV